MFGRNNSDIHAWVEERLSDYIDNQLAASERAQVDKHLSGCSQCRAGLESLKWTVSLIKQVPAPVSKKSFVLPVSPKRQPAVGFAFGFASFATVVAVLVLFAVIGVDFISQLGGGMTASAPAAAKALAPVTQQVALVPQASPTVSSAQFAAPTAVPLPTQAPRAANASSSSAASSAAGLPPAPVAAPTRAPERTGGMAETATTSALDNAKSPASSSSAGRQPLVGTSAITATVTATATHALTSTATPVPPPATLAPTTIAQAQSVPTMVPVPLPVVTSQPVVSSLRVAEIALFFLAAFFGVLVVLMRRK